ncbi:MAG TPA: Pr6Pr family membrane protein [Rhizomicrobium sp.]|jgi:hypothetical protein
MKNRMARIVAVTGACLGWAALALQLVLTLSLIHAQGGTLLAGLWQFFGYFTILANVFAASVLSLAALRRNVPRAEFAAVTAMILVGVVYSLLLRDSWNPQGAQKIADVALHDAMPLVMAVFWLLLPHGALRRVDIAASLILPLGYLAYAMIRGAFEGWYAYAFLDVTILGATRVAINAAVIGLAFLAMALLLAGLNRLLGRYRQT